MAASAILMTPIHRHTSGSSRHELEVSTSRTTTPSHANSSLSHELQPLSASGSPTKYDGVAPADYDLNLADDEEDMLLSGAGNGSRDVLGVPMSEEEYLPSVLYPGTTGLDGPIKRKQRLNLLQMACLSAYWFGWSALWMPLLVVIMPEQVQTLVGDKDKTDVLGKVMLLGSIASLLFAPIFGAMSDDSQHPMGRRRPFLISGVAVSTVGLFLMSVSGSVTIYAAAFLLLSAGNNMTLSPYSALIPDMVIPEQRGIASGVMGFMSMLGYMTGGVLVFQLESSPLFVIYLLLNIIHLGCALITITTTKERRLINLQRSFSLRRALPAIFKPFKSRDFQFLFFTRFLVQMGAVTVLENLQYYVADAIGSDSYSIFGVDVASSARQAVTILLAPLLIGALISSVVSGLASDSGGGKRKVFVYASGIAVEVACLLFAVTRSFTLDLFLSLIFGVAHGAFSSMDWAMATDVLPDENEFAKDMGVWSLSLVLPQVVAVPVASISLRYFENIGPSLHLGYSSIFVLAMVYFAVGTYYIKNIEGVR